MIGIHFRPEMQSYNFVWRQQQRGNYSVYMKYCCESGNEGSQGPTPVVKLVGEDETLGMTQRGVLPLVSQEVAQLGSRKHATVAWIVSKHGVQLGPSQQLPAELLNLDVVQAAIAWAVTPLGRRGDGRTREQQKWKWCTFQLYFWESIEFSVGEVSLQ